MSSVLNVSNESSKPAVFSLKEIEVLVESEEQNWFKRAHIGQYLEIARIVTWTVKLSEEDKRSWVFFRLMGGSMVWTP